MPFPWGEIILPYIHLLGRATDRQYLASVHNTFEHMWETLEHFWTHLRPVWALLNILKYFWTFLKIILPYLHHLGRATDRQYMARGTFRMQEMSQIHPFIFCSNFLGQMIYFLFIFFTFYKPSGGCFWQSETTNSYIIHISNFVNIKLARIIYWQYSLIWSIQYAAYKKTQWRCTI